MSGYDIIVGVSVQITPLPYRSVIPPTHSGNTIVPIHDIEKIIELFHCIIMALSVEITPLPYRSVIPPTQRGNTTMQRNIIMMVVK